MYSRLDTIPACDRRMDRQTDGRTDILPRDSPRYEYALRGKNGRPLICTCACRCNQCFLFRYTEMTELNDLCYSLHLCVYLRARLPAAVSVYIEVGPSHWLAMQRCHQITVVETTSASDEMTLGRAAAAAADRMTLNLETPDSAPAFN